MNNILFQAAAFIKRDFRIDISYKLSFSLSILSIVFRIPVFFFLSVFIDRANVSQMISYGYFPFVIIGIAASDYFSGIMNSFSDAVRQAQQEGTLEPLAASKSSLLVIILLSGLYPALYSILRSIIYFSAAIIISDIPFTDINILSTLVSLTVSTISFYSLALLSSIFVLLFKRGNPINWIIKNVSWLLSGILYPIEILPLWLKEISQLLPLTHYAKAIRLSMLEGANLQTIAPSIITLGIFTIITLPLAIALYGSAVKKIKKNNGFSHY